MDDNKPINYNRKNIKSIDEMLSDDGKNSNFLQSTYTMVQASSHNSVEITDESRKKCVKSLVR